MLVDPGWTARIRLMLVGAEDLPPPTVLAARARATPPQVLAVWLVEHLDLPDAAWNRLQARWTQAAHVAADAAPAIPHWIRALVAQAPTLAPAALQPWPTLRLTLDGSGGDDVLLTLASTLPGASALPPLVEARVPPDLAVAFWAPTAVTGWAGLLVGRRYPAASALALTLFLRTQFVVPPPRTPFRRREKANTPILCRRLSRPPAPASVPCLPWRLACRA
jgi:hypothetical protein